MITVAGIGADGWDGLPAGSRRVALLPGRRITVLGADRARRPRSPARCRTGIPRGRMSRALAENRPGDRFARRPYAARPVSGRSETFTVASPAALSSAFRNACSTGIPRHRAEPAEITPR